MVPLTAAGEEGLREGLVGGYHAQQGCADGRLAGDAEVLLQLLVGQFHLAHGKLRMRDMQIADGGYARAPGTQSLKRGCFSDADGRDDAGTGHDD